MAKKTTRVVKQTTHSFGLPCTSCHGLIAEDDKYTEEILPSETRRAHCQVCRPIHKCGTSKASRKPSPERINGGM